MLRAAGTSPVGGGAGAGNGAVGREGRCRGDRGGADVPAQRIEREEEVRRRHPRLDEVGDEVRVTIPGGVKELEIRRLTTIHEAAS